MIGSLEIVIILIAALFIFGPDKIPELAHAAGRAFGEFKKAQISAELGISDMDMCPEQKNDNDLDNKIKDIAESSGINVQGKNNDELLILIEEAARAK